MLCSQCAPQNNGSSMTGSIQCRSVERNAVSTYTRGTIGYSILPSLVGPANQPVLFLLLLPTCAWKPVLMVATERLDPQDSHDMKKMRFSLLRRVSGDLQVLHVTYSTAAGS